MNMKTCPNCNTTSIPDNATFCPNCGMWLNREGLIMTLASEPEGEHTAGGEYIPSVRERKILDYIKEEDSKIPNHLWHKYDNVLYTENRKETATGETRWRSYNTRNVGRLMQLLNYKLKHQYGIEGDWIVNEHMFRDYKKSHTLLLRVGDVIYSILIVYKIDGENIVRCEESLWQEVECKKNNYIPCFAYMTIPQNVDGSSFEWGTDYKRYDLFHAITGKPIEFARTNKDKAISAEEMRLLAVREFSNAKNLKDFRYSVYADIHIYYHNYWNPYYGGSADHYILEVNDSWGNDRIEQAKKLRNECFRFDPATGRNKGREPYFFKVNIRSHKGGSPTYDDYVCNIEKFAFYDLNTAKGILEYYDSINVSALINRKKDS